MSTHGTPLYLKAANSDSTPTKGGKTGSICLLMEFVSSMAVILLSLSCWARLTTVLGLFVTVSVSS